MPVHAGQEGKLTPRTMDSPSPGAREGLKVLNAEWTSSGPCSHGAQLRGPHLTLTQVRSQANGSDKSAILRSAAKGRSQGKLLPPSQGDRRVNAQNHSPLEQKLMRRSLRGKPCQRRREAL